jgi:hypothetical protein
MPAEPTSPICTGVRRHRLDDLAAAAELLPVDLVAGLLLELLRFLRDTVRHDHVLVADRDFLLREGGRRGEPRRARIQQSSVS